MTKAFLFNYLVFNILKNTDKKSYPDQMPLRAGEDVAEQAAGSLAGARTGALDQER